MNRKVLEAFLATSPSDEETVVQLLLRCHAAQLRRLRQFVATGGAGADWSPRSLLPEHEEGEGFSLSRLWGDVA